MTRTNTNYQWKQEYDANTERILNEVDAMFDAIVTKYAVTLYNIFLEKN